MPTITVIVPVYNVEPYLRRCVDSILAQTFTDFELILVDDGSPDNCGAICDEYAIEDARIHVIHQPNGGLSAARNAGIDWAFANSDSEWLAFVDSDDWVHPQYLEFLFRAADETGAKISLCEFARVAEQGDFPSLEYISAEIQPWDELFLHNEIPAVVAWNKLYEKKLFDGLRYPAGKIHEDEFLTYKLLHRAGNVAVLESTLYYYFQNPEGIMHRPFSLARFDASEALYEQIKYISAEKNSELNRYCVNRYLRCTWRNLQTALSTDVLTLDQKNEIEREIRRTFRSVLLRCGWKCAPPRTNAKYYRFAFPSLYALARKCVHFYRKLKGK